tara:strand:+ start:10921 stop:11370 length:450 start_codon:yes stop_codon:yes gene_type:complete
VTKNFKQLGKKVIHSNNPNKSILEKVVNPHKKENYIIRFSIPEFTSLCPVTGQPDFAKIFIDYLPNNWILESKSLKLYIQSYRNIGIFHEDAAIKIGKKIIKSINPKWIRIGGYFFPRGGIPIDIFWQYGKKPKDLWVPDHNIKVYQGR